MESKYRKYKSKYQHAKKHLQMMSGGMHQNPTATNADADKFAARMLAAQQAQKKELTPKQLAELTKARTSKRRFTDGLKANVSSMDTELSNEANAKHNARLVQCIKGNNSVECGKLGCTWEEDNTCTPTKSYKFNPFGHADIPQDLLDTFKRLQLENFKLRQDLLAAQNTIKRLEGSE